MVIRPHIATALSQFSPCDAIRSRAETSRVEPHSVRETLAERVWPRLRKGVDQETHDHL